ncbi:MAG: carboxypeptidase regulatory-like domain-containing protein, partial [bacterium]|nr:carboxypeptidase regulatory-like domain-containing protein [bacterium]
MIKKALTTTLSIFLTLPLAAEPHASVVAGSTGLTGAVLGPAGHPAANSVVQVTDNTGLVVSETRAAADGSFEVAGLQPGSYVLSARTGKRVTPRRSITLASGTTTSVTLRVGEPLLDLAGDPATVDAEIVALRHQLAAISERLDALVAQRQARVGTHAVASAAAPPVPAAPAQTQKAETLPGRGYSEKGLYQGLAAGSGEKRYGRGLFSDAVKIGGYGSFRFETNNINLGPRIGDLPPLQRGHTGFDFRRFVVTLDAAPSKRLRFYTEIEFERLNEIEVERNAIPENRGRQTRDRRGVRFIQEVEGTSAGEIAMEQAWAQFNVNDSLSIRGGVVLPPLGRFNILHDDDYWDIARRPLVSTGGPVMPTNAAWREVGAGLIFNRPIGDGYIDGQLYYLNGVQLDFAMEEVVALRE